MDGKNINKVKIVDYKEEFGVSEEKKGKYKV